MAPIPENKNYDKTHFQPVVLSRAVTKVLTNKTICPAETAQGGAFEARSSRSSWGNPPSLPDSHSVPA
jgi:hypothetical protein